jgi:hypothetical protein
MKQPPREDLRKKDDRRRGIRGELLVLSAILVISGITAFFYTRNRLIQVEQPEVTQQIQKTPTPADQKQNAI